MCRECGIKSNPADSIQIRFTYLIISMTECPECWSVAGQLCNPIGLTPSVYHTHKSRLALGEYLQEIREFRTREAKRRVQHEQRERSTS